MLKWAFIFLIIAVVAGILGFTDVEFVSATAVFSGFPFFLLWWDISGFRRGAGFACSRLVVAGGLIHGAFLRFAERDCPKTGSKAVPF